MTEAGWTRATDVTQPGWYWLRRVGGSPTVVQVIAVPGYEQRHWIVEGVNLRWSLGNMDGELLGPISLDSYKQGRVAALDEVERYMAMRLRLAEASLATEILAGNEVKQGRERAAIAELHGMQRHVSDIKEYNAQQAQGGVGDDLFILP